MSFGDRSAAALLAACGLLLATRAVVTKQSFLGGTAVAIKVSIVLVTLSVLLVASHRRGWAAVVVWPLRTAVYGSLLLFVVAGAARFKRAVNTVEAVPRIAGASDAMWARFTSDERLEWALRVSAQAVSAFGLAGSILDIPRAWPFPPDVRLAVLTDSAAVTILVATDTAVNRSCRFAVFAHLPPRPATAQRRDPIHCGPAGKAEGTRVLVRRQELGAASLPDITSAVGPIWPQYRHDAEHSARVVAELPHSAAWRVAIDGEARATASVVGPLVLIGTHGPGAVHAIDLATGTEQWTRYVPNWGHQDVVSDGRVAVVSFGDNLLSFSGRAPSGVTAFDVNTGRLLWSRFEDFSVMTSGVFHGRDVAYVTFGGVLRVVDARTGADVARMQLPGAAVMGPPALHGDTLVIGLDIFETKGEQVCAIDLHALRVASCRSLPYASKTGHSAVSIASDRVYASASVRIGGVPMSSFVLSSPPSFVGKSLLRFALALSGYYVGQRVWAMRLSDGAFVWQSRVAPSRTVVQGHLSGTLVAAGNVGLVAQPVAASLEALDLGTGGTRWSLIEDPLRGPPLVLGDRAVVTTPKGDLILLRTDTGSSLCSVRTGQTLDRAGPVLAGSDVALASREGAMLAVPLNWLSACDASALRKLFQ